MGRRGKKKVENEGGIEIFTSNSHQSRWFRRTGLAFKKIKRIGTRGKGKEERRDRGREERRGKKKEGKEGGIEIFTSSSHMSG